MDDAKFLAVATAFQIGPFLLFTLWTAVPLSDRRVVQWFAAFGRLHPGAVPMVRDRLVRQRWHRRVGALLGAVAMAGVTGWYGVVESTSGPTELIWLPVLGYAAGAVVGELRAVPAASGAERRAELTPRTTADFLAPWVLPTAGVIVATSVIGTVAAASTSVGSGGAEAAARVAAAFAGAGVALWAARRVVRLPVRTPAGTDPYLDDVFRQTSVTTCVAAAALGSLASSDLDSALFDLVAGWAAFLWIVPLYALVGACFAAMKQPVPWTFGPRIRSAWTAAASSAAAGAGAPGPGRA